MNGHDLAEEIIRKHGIDRYTTPEAKLLKLAEEVGELVREFNKGWGSHEFDIHAFAKEYADVGLTLYQIGNHFNLNLEDEMLAVVNGDNRKFA